MNSVSSITETSWSIRRYCWIAAFIFVAQVVLVWIAEERPRPFQTDSETKTSFQLIAAPLKSEDVFNLIAAPLPDVLALPSEAGFSGTGWLKLKRTSYTPPQWNEPPRWLEYDGKYLGKTLNNAFTAAEPGLQEAQRIFVRDDIPVFLPQTGQDSSLHVKGPIASRYIDSVILPSWQNFEPLLDTVVEIGVNNAGQVVSPRLSSRSGSAAADQKALEVARVAKFQPLNIASANVVFGKMIFRWETLPMSVTNNVEKPR